MKNKFYQLAKVDNKAILNIYGDIIEDAWGPGEFSPTTLVEKFADFGEVDEIEVHIDSYGGSVSAGFCIYNLLKEHKAKVTTICEGFACSIASIIFLAGNTRIMREASILMIHNPWTFIGGDSNVLRKEADTLDKMAQVSIDIYCKTTGLEEEKIKEMMDVETWITSKEAKEMGFATEIQEEEKEEDVIVQSVKQSLIKKITEPQIVEKVVEVEKEVVVAPKTTDKFLNIFKGEK